jgi:hypothetical protein
LFSLQMNSISSVSSGKTVKYKHLTGRPAKPDSRWRA